MHLPRPDRRPNARDLMGDQMVQVTRWVTRIPPWPELGKLGCQLGRDQNIWLSVSVIIFLHHLIFAQKAQLLWRSGHQSGHLEWSGLPWAIWSSRSDLVAHQVVGALGRLSGRGKCIQLKYAITNRWLSVMSRHIEKNFFRLKLNLVPIGVHTS